MNSNRKRFTSQSRLIDFNTALVNLHIINGKERRKLVTQISCWTKHIVHKSTTRGTLSNTLQSAGTAEPDARRTQSPGTSNAPSICDHLPSRLAVATGFKVAFNAATALPALVISYQPMVALQNYPRGNRKKNDVEKQYVEVILLNNLRAKKKTPNLNKQKSRIIYM